MQILAEWDEKDVKAGLVVGRPECQERLMIGFIPRLHNQPALLSQSDGQVTQYDNKAQVAAYLSTGWLPVAILEIVEQLDS